MTTLLSFWGTKGGVGKTFCAINFSQCLAAELDCKVLLLDANYPVSSDIHDLMPDFDYACLDTVTVHDNLQLMNLPQASVLANISVLGLHSRMSLYDHSLAQITTHLDTLINQLAQEFDYIVIDAGSSYNEVTNKLFDLSSLLFIVTDASPSSISRVGQDVEFLKGQNYASDSMSLIVNKNTKTSQITRDWLYATFGLDCDALLPFEKKFEFYTSKSKNPLLRTKLWQTFQTLVLVVEQIKNLTNTIQPSSDSLDDRRQYNNTILANEIQYRELKILIHQKLLKLLDLKRIDIKDEEKKIKELEDKIKINTIEILNQFTVITERDLRNNIVNDLIKESLYLGVLEDLLADEKVSEIMVNRWDQIYVEQNGKILNSPKKFLSEKQLMRIIERIVAPLGRRIDISSPMVDARTHDGSRVNVIIPPLATNGAVMTIRKFSKEALGIKDLIGFGTINQQVVDFLKAAVVSKLNVIISGGTGTGKTTMLNILSSFIPENERVITVEDAAELRLLQPHVITLEARPKNIEDKGEVSIRDLVKNSLRMRPDRIVVGECRAGEALDMLQAMNTGHDGSMTTIHANSTGEMLSRLETLVMYAGTDLPSKAIREQINSAVNIVMQISRMHDGSRKVIQISEVVGMENGDIKFEHIFLYKQKGIDSTGTVFGDFVSTGYIPICLEEFAANGVEIPKEVFWAH